jgi:hypothetical protein
MSVLFLLITYLRVYAGVLGISSAYISAALRGLDARPHHAGAGPIQYYVHDRLGVPLVVTDRCRGHVHLHRAFEDPVFAPTSPLRIFGHTWLNYIVAVVRSSGGAVRHLDGHTAWLNLKRGIKAPDSGSTARNGRDDRGADGRTDLHRRPGSGCRAQPSSQPAWPAKPHGEPRWGSVHAAQLLAAWKPKRFSPAT